MNVISRKYDYSQFYVFYVLCSDTHRDETSDTVVASTADVKCGRTPVTATGVSRHSESTARQTWIDQGKATSKGRHPDVAVKRKQIGLKRKSLQEMRQLLNTAAITVYVFTLHS